MDKKDGRIIVKGDEAQKALLKGAEMVYDTVTTTFGPRGRNVLARKPFGRPLLTRDGVTVARETYFTDEAPNMGAQLLLEASETTNRIAGDGTTATVALGFQLMKAGNQMINAGNHPMVVADTIRRDADLLLDELEKMGHPVKKDQLTQVASVSSGDPLLGQLIAEAVKYVGPNGGILPERAPIETVEREYVDGYYLQSGFTALIAGKKELINPWVVVCERRLTSPQDAGELLTKVAQIKQLQQGNIGRFLLIGNIEGAAYTHIVDLINKGVLDAIIVKTPPQFGGEMSRQLLEDIAIFAGCEPLTDSTNLRNFTEGYVGEVDKVVASKNETTLFGDTNGELVEDRVKTLKEQLESETIDGVAEKLRDRIAKLEGKIALFKIGGATETEKEELEFRVEDAILATRGAEKSGVVPGGGATLLALSNTKGISDATRNALRSVFGKLLTNANLQAELKLDEALKAKPGFGFNLRKGDELVDLEEAGILDPKLVVEQIIRNASSVAAAMLTTDVLLIPDHAAKEPEAK